MKPQTKVPVRLIAVGAVVIVLAIGAAILVPRGGAKDTPPVTTAATVRHSAKAATVSKQLRRPLARKARGSSKVVGLAAIERALLRNPVVVVAAYQPESMVDVETELEAKAGATAANAAFVALNVDDEQEARALTVLLRPSPTAAAIASGSDTLPSTPAVLVMRRPRALFVNFNGYVDRQIVAQAAAAAAGRPGGEAWQLQANSVCSAGSRQITALYASTPALARQALAIRQKKAVEIASQLVSDAKAIRSRLAAVRVPASRTREYQRLLDIFDRVAVGWRSWTAAMQKNDPAGTTQALLRILQLAESAGPLTADLGIPACR